jgi:glutaredoxin
MFIPLPLNYGMTVYSKSGCSGCNTSVAYIEEMDLELKYVLCDEFLREDRTYFLNVMKQMSGREIKQFPIIFKDGKYFGGLNELTNLIAEN